MSNTNGYLCPILYLSERIHDPACMRDDCAWWQGSKEHGDCVINQFYELMRRRREL